MTGAADWRGRVGEVWAAEYVRTERAFSAIAAALDAAIAAVAPVSGLAVDLGCGVGGTTLALAAARPMVQVTGIDLSPALIALARRRVGEAAGAPAFVVGDVLHVLPTLAPLDLLVSRHGLMFFADPVAAFSVLRAATAPGAPLVFSCFAGRPENEWVTVPERALGLSSPVDSDYAPGPFALADGTFTRALLHDGGWNDVQIRPWRLDYVVGSGPDPVEDALAFYRCIGPLASLLSAATPAERQRLEQRLRDVLASRIRDGAVTFSAAIWIITARAGKEVA
ncbi:class I SAM-dependent methyltransferase [uncultured Sphingomonas sp.]|uniref:class I SAM-dependent methyltransferase n=1 Tax=uncultured Sphingomonas sp. TaxID=158754 RepID=UPI0030F8E54D